MKPRTIRREGKRHRRDGRKRGALKVLCIGALHLKAKDFGGTSDPYCEVTIIKEIDVWHFATEIKHPKTRIPYTPAQIDEVLDHKQSSKFWRKKKNVDLEEEEVVVFLSDLKGMDKQPVRQGLRDYFEKYGNLADIQMRKTVALVTFEHRGTAGLRKKDFVDSRGNRKKHEITISGSKFQCPVYPKTIAYERTQRDHETVLMLRTETKNRNLNPDWNETLIFENYRPGPHRYALIRVMDYDFGNDDDLIGETKIRLPRTWGHVRKYVEMIEDTEGKPSGAVVIEFLLSKTVDKQAE